MYVWSLGTGRENQAVVSRPEKVLTVMIISTAPEEDVTRISEKLSDMTEERYGFGISLIGVPREEHRTTLNRLTALGRGPDVFVAFQQSALTDFIGKGYVLALDDLLEDYPVLEGGVPREYWDTVTLNGHIYGIPSNCSSSYAQGFMARKDLLDELGVDASGIRTWEELHSLLLLVKNTYQDRVPVVPHCGALLDTFEEDSLCDGLGVLLGHRGTTVENLYESEEFYQLCKLMHQWYSEGLILENGFSYTTEPRNTLIKAFDAFGFFGKINEYTSTNCAITEGYEMVNIQLSAPYVDTELINVCWCISSQTENQKEAMELIELLYTDREAVDLCMYGEEGRDYRRVDESHVTAIGKKGSWNTTLWGWPNREPASAWLSPDTSEPTTYRVEGEAVVSPAFGFVFDSGPVQLQVDSCKKVVERYAGALMCGYLDPDQAIPLFNEALYEAGIDEVIAEKQAQLDRYLEKDQ